jgi:hypothetical protein
MTHDSHLPAEVVLDLTSLNSIGRLLRNDLEKLCPTNISTNGSARIFAPSLTLDAHGGSVVLFLNT